MFPLALSLPLLVSPLAPLPPIYDVSNLQFNPLAYTTTENFAASPTSYKNVKFEVLPNVTFKNVKFDAAPSHLVNPVFSVEGLN